MSAIFVSGDWGTSRLRLHLVKTDPFEILESVESSCGIASVNDALLESESDRQAFFHQVLREEMRSFESSVDGLPVVISGMASSSIGLREVDYATLPQPLSAPLPFERVEAGLTLISGLRWESRDVMRGEETQIAGVWANPSLVLPDRFRILLPGTHSKHVLVEDGVLTEFLTFLTGDLYQAMREHTILKHAMPSKSGFCDATAAFRDGVRRAQEEPLDRALFGLRCASLFGQREAQGNAEFLSGLLIGSELKGLEQVSEQIVVPQDELGCLYLEALSLLGVGERVLPIPADVMEEAVPRAQALYPAYRQVVHRSRG